MITDIAGSSAWFERGFVTYSNEAKAQMIGVREETLAQHGAVSEPVVVEMAIGALKAVVLITPCLLVVSPGRMAAVREAFGTVWFAFATARGEGITRRNASAVTVMPVRRQATAYALQTLCNNFYKTLDTV
ncbi:competence damage-inducible protein A [Escherichia coli]|uniref:Competence damage-inducible protein A n=1 Tax=Escherichia coli TaxID=562 RepID=A0A377C442_ECOLX|nr:competence damage-inducible protein A [Escherichia coli]